VAGRELPAGDAVTADRRLTAIARALKDGGAAGSLDQLRAAVFVALLTGRDPQSLLPAHPGGKVPGTTRAGCGCAGGVAGLAGSVHLTLPLATWLGGADRPGEVAGLGPVDAGTCRELAGRLAAGPGAAWCLTLTDAGGRAAAHACARNGPGPPPGRARSPSADHGPPGPAVPAVVAAWLSSLELQWLERGDCGHQRQGSAYRPGRALRHLIQVRHRTCAHPGCRRPAQDCDIDHTTPYDQGGRTCECNCAPLCNLCRRRHNLHYADVLVMPMSWLEAVVGVGLVAGRSA